MLDAIGEARIGLLAAEVEVRLAGMADRPFADAVVQFEQAGLVGHFAARLGRYQPARRGRRNRRLLLARTLADEPARAEPHYQAAIEIDGKSVQVQLGLNLTVIGSKELADEPEVAAPPPALAAPVSGVA